MAKSFVEGISQRPGQGRPWAHPMALVALGLICVSSLSMSVYTLVWIHVTVPPFIQFCFLVLSAGVGLACYYFTLADEIFGTTIGHLMVAFVRGYKHTVTSMMVMMAIPDLRPGDIRIIFRSKLHDKIDSNGSEYLVQEGTPSAPPSPTNNSRKTPLALPSGATKEAEHPVERVASAEGDGFDAAAEWLKRPQLYVGLREQLGLYGLYSRARRNFRSNSGPPATNKPWLEDAKAEARRAFARMPRPVARAQLVRRLAKADPLFAITHPEVGIPPENGVLGILLGLFERRLPIGSADVLAKGHSTAWRGCFSVMFLFGLRAMWKVANKRSLNRSPKTMMALFASFLAFLYTLALSRGVPPHIHHFCAKLLASLRGRTFSIGMAGLDAEGPPRILQYLAVLFVPRMNQSLFALQALAESPTSGELESM